jgi:hypothetical protein
MEKQIKEATRPSESIIRQSQLERSVEIFTLMGIKPSLKEILRLSQVLTNFQYDWNLQAEEIKMFDKHYKLVTEKQNGENE